MKNHDSTQWNRIENRTRRTKDRAGWAHTLRMPLATMSLIAALFIAAGCADTQTSAPEVVHSDNDPVEVQMNAEGILEFTSLDAFMRIALRIHDTEAEQAEPRVEDVVPDFVSMRSVFDDFSQEESDALDTMPERDEPFDTLAYIKFTPLGQQYSDMILVRRYPDDNAYYYDLNVGTPRLATVVTPGGDVIIGDDLYHFTRETVTKRAADDLTDPPTELTADEKALFGYSEIIGDVPGKRAAACSNPRKEKRTQTSGRYRATLLLNFAQASGLVGGNNVNLAFLEVDVKPERHRWGAWRAATASSIHVSGAFSGPRSPMLQNGSFGYLRSNPFTNALWSSTLRHFNDESSPALPCFEMTHATYSATVSIGGTTLTPVISW